MPQAILSVGASVGCVLYRGKLSQKVVLVIFRCPCQTARSTRMVRPSFHGRVHLRTVKNTYALTRRQRAPSTCSRPACWSLVPEPFILNVYKDLTTVDFDHGSSVCLTTSSKMKFQRTVCPRTRGQQTRSERRQCEVSHIGLEQERPRGRCTDYIVRGGAGSNSVQHTLTLWYFVLTYVRSVCFLAFSHKKKRYRKTRWLALGSPDEPLEDGSTNVAVVDRFACSRAPGSRTRCGVALACQLTCRTGSKQQQRSQLPSPSGEVDAARSAEAPERAIQG